MTLPVDRGIPRCGACQFGFERWHTFIPGMCDRAGEQPPSPRITHNDTGRTLVIVDDLPGEMPETGRDAIRAWYRDATKAGPEGPASA